MRVTAIDIGIHNILRSGELSRDIVLLRSPAVIDDLAGIVIRPCLVRAVGGSASRDAIFFGVDRKRDVC